MHSRIVTLTQLVTLSTSSHMFILYTCYSIVGSKAYDILLSDLPTRNKSYLILSYLSYLLSYKLIV